MLKRVSALTVALALGGLMLGCQPADQGGGGGGTMEERQPGETLASPSPGTGGGGGMGDQTPDNLDRDTGDRGTPDRGMPDGNQ